MLDIFYRKMYIIFVNRKGEKIMEKDVLVTMTMNVENNKKVIFVLSKTENDNTNNSIVNDIAQLNYLENLWSDSKVVDAVDSIMREVRDNEEECPTYIYELKMSMVGVVGIEDSYAETYHYFNDAYSTMLSYMNGNRSIPFRNDINVRDIVSNSSYNDIKDASKNSKKYFDNLSTSIKKKCKDHCVNMQECSKSRGFNRWYYCSDGYKCPFSTGNEEHSGDCICKDIGMAIPSTWNV